ncbi:hypothetical protein AB0J81_37910 [Streptomyces bobili]|uniref:hypothetical protein n=1 Tax=Streptomyces bobili TaxID=67280 RepID=UPI00344540DB
MSVPTHDPLVVNTKDGSCWWRRAVTQSGHGLYALAAVQGEVPELVLSTLAELAEHGLASMAFALPMPSGPEPRDVEDELTGANLSLWEEEQTTARLRLALASAQRGRRELRAEVAELREERHSTNEALDDAVQALREQRDRFEMLRALCDAADHVGIVSGGWFTVEAVRRAAAGEPLPKPDGITRRLAPTQALREDDEFHLHHTYRVPRDLPGLGGVE